MVLNIIRKKDALSSLGQKMFASPEGADIVIFHDRVGYGEPITAIWASGKVSSHSSCAFGLEELTPIEITNITAREL